MGSMFARVHSRPLQDCSHPVPPKHRFLWIKVLICLKFPSFPRGKTPGPQGHPSAALSKRLMSRAASTQHRLNNENSLHGSTAFHFWKQKLFNRIVTARPDAFPAHCKGTNKLSGGKNIWKTEEPSKGLQIGGGIDSNVVNVVPPNPPTATLWNVQREFQVCQGKLWKMRKTLADARNRNCICAWARRTTR